VPVDQAMPSRAAPAKGRLQDNLHRPEAGMAGASQDQSPRRLDVQVNDGQLNKIAVE
jgi:hypothetical protein